MSLAVLADHMASKGRGPDTMLVHMAPEEVRGLQALAESHGGSLTINPETGLPEAGFLKKLLPTIIGFGLSYLSGGTIDPVTAGMIVGGVETARTGDIGKGISAGLGAYGGAGIGSGMATAGTNAMTTAGVEGYAGELAAQGLTAGTPEFGQAASEMALQSQKDAIASPFSDKLSAGFQATTSSPQATAAFAKDNAKNLMYAAGPAVMAGANVESKLPQTVTRPGMIRPYAYDPYGGSYEAGVPYEATAKAAGGGLMGMADGGYNPGVLDFAQRSEPVVRMANGGAIAFAEGGMTPEELRAQIEAGPRTQAALDQAFATYSPAQLAAAFPEFGGVDQYTAAAAEARARNTPAADTSGFTVGPGPGPDNYTIPGGTVDQGYSRDYTPEQRIGINQAYIRSQQDAGYGVKGLMADMEKTGVTAKDIALSYGMGEHGVDQYLTRNGASADFGGINAGWDTKKQDEFIKWQNSQPNPTGQGTMGDVYKKQGISDTDPIRRAQAQEVIERQEARAALRAKAGSGFALSGGVTAPDPTTPGPTNPQPGGPYVPTPGPSNPTTPTNPPPTVVTPNIPGRPDGGFTGMGNVRDVYTAGGGSLGYTPYVPTSMADFDAKYNTQTGGSKQQYDQLTGKTAYSPTPYTPTGELMKPYYESVGRMPVNMKTKKYIFKDGKYVLNPEYVKPSYVVAAEKNATFLNPDTKPTSDPGAGKEWVWDTVGKKWESRTIPPPPSTRPEDPPGNKNGGVMRMAQGGLGALAAGGSASQYNLGGYSDGGRLLRGPGDGVSDSIPATIGNKRPARLADGEFVVPARIVSELGNGSTEAGARKLYAMMDRVQKARGKTTGKGRVAKNSRADKYLPA